MSIEYVPWNILEATSQEYVFDWRPIYRPCGRVAFNLWFETPVEREALDRTDVKLQVSINSEYQKKNSLNAVLNLIEEKPSV